VRTDFEDLEHCLFFFHEKCKTALDALFSHMSDGPQSRANFLSDVDVAAAEAFVKRGAAKDYRHSLVRATAKYLGAAQYGCIRNA
jgi:hypothetical protein